MPVCFMITPYGREATQAEAGRGPAEIDFNALWDRALGYEPVRADQDTDGLIISPRCSSGSFLPILCSPT
jgi:hypothetical protein